MKSALVWITQFQFPRNNWKQNIQYTNTLDQKAIVYSMYPPWIEGELRDSE